MKLKIGEKWEITSDNYCYIVNLYGRTTNPKTKKINKEKKILRKFYYPSLTSSFQCILRNEIQQSDAESIEEILKHIKEVKELIVSVIGKENINEKYIKEISI